MKTHASAFPHATAKRTLQVGVIGLGFMGKSHIGCYQRIPGVEVATICNPTGGRLDGNFSNAAGNIATAGVEPLDMRRVKATRDPAELFNDPALDIIDICSPTKTHVDYATAALKAGKHVICEKPLARTAERARGVAELAERSPGFLLPAMPVRFQPQYMFLKEAIAKQTYGPLISASFRRVCEPPGWGKYHSWEGSETGGALMDLHVHDADFIQYCLGLPRAVFSRGRSLVTGAIDLVVTQYVYDSGPIVHAEASWAVKDGFGFTCSFSAAFETASLDYDFRANTLRLYEKGREPRNVELPDQDLCWAELKHMIESIQAGKPPSIVTAWDAYRTVLLCECEERSVVSGQVVELPTDAGRK
jgi:predicted dehydrogenase